MKSVVGPPGVANAARRRHLPIVKEPSAEEAVPARAPWQWVVFGAVAIFVVWIPLAAASMALMARAGAIPSDVASNPARPASAALLALVSVLALGVAAAAGGFLVGRWSGRDGSPKTAALAGGTAAAVAVAASWASIGVALAALLVVPIAAGFAYFGGWLGRRAA
jgi:hypothetical protein